MCIIGKQGGTGDGKDTDFLAFDNTLLVTKREGFSYNKPRIVCFDGMLEKDAEQGT